MAKQSTIARRAMVIALKAYTTKSSAEIAALTELSVPSVNRIYAEAIKRGFDPHRTMVDNQYVEDKPRSGRPTKQDPSTVDIVRSKVLLDRYGREKTCADLAGDLSKLGIRLRQIRSVGCQNQIRIRSWISQAYPHPIRADSWIPPLYPHPIRNIQNLSALAQDSLILPTIVKSCDIIQLIKYVVHHFSKL
jgi:hypothetical protein